MENKVKPPIALSNKDGNAYVILGSCVREAKKNGWSTEQVESFITEAQSGDYDHLLQTVLSNFEVT